MTRSDEFDICQEVAAAIAGHPGELWWETEMRSMRGLLAGWLIWDTLSVEDQTELRASTEALVS